MDSWGFVGELRVRGLGVEGFGLQPATLRLKGLGVCNLRAKP